VASIEAGRFFAVIRDFILTGACLTSGDRSRR
jgi:hypothetical protein